MVGARHPPELGLAQRLASRVAGDVHLFFADHAGLSLRPRCMQAFILGALPGHALGPSRFILGALRRGSLLISGSGVLCVHGLALGAGLVAVDRHRR
jgi:hypothetical protein